MTLEYRIYGFGRSYNFEVNVEQFFSR